MDCQKIKKMVLTGFCRSNRKPNTARWARVVCLCVCVCVREREKNIQHNLKSCQNLILLKTNLSLIFLRKNFLCAIFSRWNNCCCGCCCCCCCQLDEKINLQVQKYQLWEFVKTEGTGIEWKMELKFLVLRNEVVENFDSWEFSKSYAHGIQGPII